MRKEDKNQIIDDIAETLSSYKNFYIADIGGLNAVDTAKLRRKCFEKEVKLMVVKNTLLRKALEKSDKNFEELNGTLHTPTSVMFSNNSSVPAKLIKEFRATKDKPFLKAAFVEESIYIGDNQLDALASLKSKEELVGDIIMLLQSPMKTVVSQLQSGKNIIAGVVKTLAEKE